MVTSVSHKQQLESLTGGYVLRWSRQFVEMQLLLLGEVLSALEREDRHRGRRLGADKDLVIQLCNATDSAADRQPTKTLRDVCSNTTAFSSIQLSDWFLQNNVIFLLQNN